MADEPPNQDIADTVIDVRLAEVLDKYLEQVEAGTAMSRDDFLRQHPDLADRLVACLDGVELFAQGNLPRGDSKTGEHAFQEIGDYELLGELGRGGMGVVYEAREKSLDRIVALKVMRFGIVDPRALERFQREAETAGALHHTNIVPVYATGREGDTSWYAMQRIEGESLAQRIERAYHGESKQGVRVQETVDIGLQAAEALSHAHQRDVVHRDVKPANLIIDQEGRVWLTDFGLARRLVDVGATMTGALLGTPRYMSPEQADLAKVDVDHRSDIYSLGATLYELATGRPPFEGDDPLSVMSQIRYEEPPSPKQVRADLPRDLDVVLMKCLSKASDRRYSTAAELADDLRAIGEDRAISARATSSLEHLVRWARKNQSRVRIASLAALATIACVMLAMTGYDSWHESTLGSFRLRAAGGPYSASVQPVNATSIQPSKQSGLSLTVPMQKHQKLPIGDYDVMLAPRGRWSKNVRLPIRPGTPTELRLRRARESVREISIEGKNAVPIAGFDGPSVLLGSKGQLQRKRLDATKDWTLDVSRIPTKMIQLGESAESTDEETIDLNFAVDLRADAGWYRSTLDENPKLASPQLALREPIDLDGDEQADCLVAATDKSALLAIDANGKVLWARAYDLNGEFENGNLCADGKPADQIFPGVLEMRAVADQDDDKIRDIVAQLIHIRPGVQTDIALVLLSGKTGDVIQATHLPGIPQNIVPKSWPMDGVLKVGSQQRRTGGLNFSPRRVLRSHQNENFYFKWRRGARSRDFTVPSPMKCMEIGEQLIGVALVGDRCYRYDLNTGEEVAAPIVLTNTATSKPRIANQAKLGNEVLVFTEHHATDHKLLKGGFAHGSRTVAYDLHGKLLWEKIMPYVEHRDGEALMNSADWPLIADLNQDGRDEVIMFLANQGGAGIAMLVLDAQTGQATRKEMPIAVFGSATKAIERLTVSTDLDNDGWREIATACIAGPATPTGSTSIADAFIYVNWISGRTGESLAWSRFMIPHDSNNVSVAEIDGIRSLGSHNSGVEVDFVTGEMPDRDLDSYVLRFQPDQTEPAAMATGLTVCNCEFVGADSESQVRVFHQRPGPFADGDESLLLMAEADGSSVRLGESTVVASWKTNSGRELAAIMEQKSQSLCVIDTDNLQTVWSTKGHHRHARFFPVRRREGGMDLLYQKKFYSLPILLDGGTGQQRWQLSGEEHGNIMHVEASQNPGSPERFLVIRDCNHTWSSNKSPPNFLHISMVNSTGEVIWAKQVLWKAARHNRPNDNEITDLFRLHDLTGDGIPDVLGPDQVEGKDVLLLRAWDGVSGNVLWTQDRKLSGVISNYYPGPTNVVSVDGRACVAFLESTNFVLHDGTTGAELASFPLPKDHRRVGYSTRQRKSVSIADCSLPNSQTRIGLLSTGRKSQMQWTMFGLEDGKLEVLDEWYPKEKGVLCSGVWLRDTTDDNIPERLVATESAFACYSLESKEPLWKIDLPADWHRHFRWAESSDCVWILPSNESDDRLLINWRTGTLISPGKLPGVTDDNLPLVLPRSEEDESSVRMLMPIHGGTVIREMGRQTADELTRPHQWPDPRLQRRFRLAMHNESMSTILGKGVQAAFAAGVCSLPFIYFGTMIWRRKWSLSWLFFAPVVVLLFLAVWNARWFQETQFLGLMLSGFAWILTPLGLYVAWTVTSGNDVFPNRRIRWKLIATIALVVIAINLFSEFAQREVGTHFQVAPRDILFFAIAGIGYGLRYYFGMWFFHALFKIFGGTSTIAGQTT